MAKKKYNEAYEKFGRLADLMRQYAELQAEKEELDEQLKDYEIWPGRLVGLPQSL